MNPFPALALILTSLVLICPALLTSADAADHPYISVGQAKTKKTVIAFPDILGAPDTAKTLHDTVVSDLQFMDLFRFIGKAAFVEPPGTGIILERFKMTDWSSIGSEFVVKSATAREGANIVLEAYLYDVLGAKQVLAKRYITLVVNKNRQIVMNEKVLPPGTLRARLEAIRAAKPDVQLYIQGDQGVPYGFIAQVMAEVKRAKINRVGLVTEPGDNASRI